MKIISPYIILVLCIIGLWLTAGCATYKVRVPLGADEKFGAVEIGTTYFPPRDYQRLYDLPAILPPWVKIPKNPFRPSTADGKSVTR